MEARGQPVAAPHGSQHRQRTIVGWAIALGLGWAAILTAGTTSFGLGMLGVMGSGLAAGVYLALLYWVRGRPRDIAAAGCIAFLAATHLVWIILASLLLQGIPLPAWIEDGSLLLVTGLVLGLGVGLASWSVWTGLGVSVAGVLSGSFVVLLELYDWGDSGPFIGCALLHISLVSIVAHETLRRLARARCSDSAYPGACAQCGYPREGLPAGAPCPECGREHTDG